MKRLTLLIALIVSLGSFGQKNLLVNGDFENQLSNWTSLQGENESYATFTAETKNTYKGTGMKVSVRRPGTNQWDIQSIVPIKLKKKKNYRLSFYGRTRTPGAEMKAVIQNQKYSEKIFALTTRWEKYEWEFKTEEEILEFKFQYFSKGSFFIDEVLIERI